jgi:cytochrome b pre-mRNA-processing protein 3
MGLLDRLREKARDAARPVLPGEDLYRAVVARARTPGWYTAGGVPDTLDGRFDMVALVLSTVLLRLERDGTAHADLNVALTERFVDDMDGSLREMGVGDLSMGKYVGRMVSALGGRLGAYREALREGADLDEALRRNLYRGEPVDPAALAWTRDEALRLFSVVDAAPVAGIDAALAR